MTRQEFPPPPPYVVESAFGRFVHREFPVQIARIRQAKKQCERWAVR